MARISLSLIMLAFSVGMAHAHWGHLGDIAGHAHWLGLGAAGIAGAIAVAAGLLSKKPCEGTEEETDEVSEEEGETA